jgi:hypothetical protein
MKIFILRLSRDLRVRYVGEGFSHGHLNIPIGIEESVSLELVKFAIAALKILALPTGRAVVFAKQIAGFKIPINTDS